MKSAENYTISTELLTKKDLTEKDFIKTVNKKIFTPDFLKTLSQEVISDFFDELNINSFYFVERMILNNEYEFLNKLINSGVDVNLRNKYGNTLLHSACLSGMSDECATLLIELGANVNIEDEEEMSVYDYAIDGDIPSQKLTELIINKNILK